MQSLLKGKSRLPGFEVESGFQSTELGMIPLDWQVAELASIGKFKNGINKGNEDFGHGMPFVNLMDVFGVQAIHNSEKLGLVNSSPAERSTYDLRSGDVLFIRSSVKPSGVGLTALVQNDLPSTVYSGFLIRFRDGGVLEKNYKKYCFQEQVFRNNLIANSTVSANTNINQNELKKLFLVFPKNLEEQRAIVSLLSDMDTEIEALESKLAKYKQIKQGMMQNLLTGRIRLI